MAESLILFIGAGISQLVECRGGSISRRGAASSADDCLPVRVLLVWGLSAACRSGHRILSARLGLGLCASIDACDGTGVGHG